MARYRRGDSLTIHLVDALEVEGESFEVDLIAKHATGVEGYRMTVAFLATRGSGNVFADLEPATSREEVQVRAEALRVDPHRLVELARMRVARR